MVQKIAQRQIEGLKETLADVNKKVNGCVTVQGLPPTPLQGEITAAWVEAMGGGVTPYNGAEAWDASNTRNYTYFEDTKEWALTSGAASSSGNIMVFTNDVAGTIKGSTKDGDVSANEDGTGTVAGYAALADKVQQNSTDIADNVTEINKRLQIVLSTEDIGEGAELPDNTLYGVYKEG